MPVSEVDKLHHRVQEEQELLQIEIHETKNRVYQIARELETVGGRLDMLETRVTGVEQVERNHADELLTLHEATRRDGIRRGAVEDELVGDISRHDLQAEANEAKLILVQREMSTLGHQVSDLARAIREQGASDKLGADYIGKQTRYTKWLVAVMVPLIIAIGEASRSCLPSGHGTFQSPVQGPAK